MLSVDPDIRRLVAARVVERGLLRLRWLAATTRFEIALVRHERALKFAYKAYNPDQPRVPAGNPDGGQWSGGGDHAPRTRLAGDGPTGDPPDVPKKKPPTSKERTRVKKAVARWFDQIGGTAERVMAIAKLSTWLQTYVPEIESYRDPPRSLEDLQEAVSSPKLGYQRHHIVEQAQAEREGFTREAIDGPENLVRIPTLRHQEINGWYQTANPDFGWRTPREYLSGRSWEVKRAVGLEALRLHGVLR
jgi:hypothetical protein